jgi:hypothetical protein
MIIRLLYITGERERENDGRAAVGERGEPM